MKITSVEDLAQLDGCIIRGAPKPVQGGLLITVYVPAEERLAEVLIVGQSQIGFSPVALNGAKPIVISDGVRIQTVDRPV